VVLRALHGPEMRENNKEPQIILTVVRAIPSLPRILPPSEARLSPPPPPGSVRSSARSALRQRCTCSSGLLFASAAISSTFARSITSRSRPVLGAALNLYRVAVANVVANALLLLSRPLFCWTTLLKLFIFWALGHFYFAAKMVIT
jgi:hypothetical protein